MSIDLWQYRESLKFAARNTDLTGFEVISRDGLSIGTVDKISNDVRVNYIVVDTGDWLGEKQVILPAYTIERVDGTGRKVFVDQTRDDVRKAPELNPKRLRGARFEDALTGYYHGIYDTGL